MEQMVDVTLEPKHYLSCYRMRDFTLIIDHQSCIFSLHYKFIDVICNILFKKITKFFFGLRTLCSKQQDHWGTNEKVK
jgi:hypothetical protein